MRAKAVYAIKALARRLRYGPSDLLRRRRGGPPVPPRHLSFVGGGDFERTGREFLGYFTELGGLEPGDRVLDIGCGIGRMALPLTTYLDQGSYAGFDVGREMVRWCDRNITPRWPNFEFGWAPVYNAKYNPFGTISGAEFRFPYDDESFDFAFATSLFTHLLRAEASHYLAETARILRPGGACLLTFFLLTPEAEREIEAGRARFDFRHPIDGGLTTDRRQPEEAVAFRAEEIRALLGEVGLSIREPLHLGRWANAPGGLSLQDIVVAERPA
jgi:Methylase involved in ubiquinone/menaquinone biosynthesis